MKVALGILACGAALALPASAVAVKCAPPGNSGVDQYAETIPGASCNGQPGSHHHHGAGGPGNGGGFISPGTTHALSGQGGAGRAVQKLVANTGTAGTAGNGAGNHQSVTAASSSAGSASGRSGSGKTGSTHGGSGGAGTGSAASAVHSAAPNVNGRNLVSALLHPIVTGASHAGGTGAWLPIFLGLALVVTFGGLVIRRRRLVAARRRWTG
jgi:LPXTG-motif cell wall-anchored protein